MEHKIDVPSLRPGHRSHHSSHGSALFLKSWGAGKGEHMANVRRDTPEGSWHHFTLNIRKAWRGWEHPTVSLPVDKGVPLRTREQGTRVQGVPLWWPHWCSPRLSKDKSCPAWQVSTVGWPQTGTMPLLCIHQTLRCQRLHQFWWLGARSSPGSLHLSLKEATSAGSWCGAA